ncbi:Flp family type IVb pilin [Aeromicrobium sp. CTD01-1L150]|uniref:Flp family type IVb pilin n=1 Tax=Aeromicrobium sp. CTD01-1L150 TaxID=3341830 RepID=UPI0035C138C8
MSELQMIVAYVRAHIDQTTTRRGEGGATGLEYLLLAGIILVGVIAAAYVVRTRLSGAADSIPAG